MKKMINQLFHKKKKASIPDSQRVLFVQSPALLRAWPSASTHAPLERYVPSAALLKGGKEYTAFMKSKKEEIASAHPTMSLREVCDTAKNEWFVFKGKPQMPVLPEHVVKKYGKYFTSHFIKNDVMVAAMEAFIKSKTTSGKQSDAYKKAKTEWYAMDAAAKWKCMEPLVAPMAAEEKERRRIGAMIASAARKEKGTYWQQGLN